VYSSLHLTWENYSAATAGSAIDFVSDFDTATGIVKVFSDGTGTATLLTGETWSPKTVVRMRIVVTSTYSTLNTGSAYDELYLTLSDQPIDLNCANNRISLSTSYYSNSYAGTPGQTGPEIDDFTYTIGDAEVTKTPGFSTYIA
jgi:hypothetical protein